jgi:hypothetical protein
MQAMATVSLNSKVSTMASRPAVGGGVQDDFHPSLYRNDSGVVQN